MVSTILMYKDFVCNIFFYIVHKFITFLANGNRYEGEWQNNMKNGFGKFFYYEKGQLYEGVWVNDVAKCGEIVEFEKEFVTSLTIQAIPEVRLLVCF